MKAISEYFRDLAERDRFFGAEPPQPDAEYLHRIAEQTIKSRVAAEVSDNSLILRQEQDEANTAPVVAPAVAAAAAPAAAPEPTPAPEPAPVAQPETAAFVEPAISAQPNLGQGDTIAEKLQRIRAVVSRENAEPAEATSFYNEDEHADDFATSDPVEPPASFTADEAYEEDAEDSDADILGSIMADIGETPEDEAVTDDSADSADADEADAVAEDAVAEADAETDAVAEDALADTAPEADIEATAEDAAAEDVVAEDTVAEDVVAEDAVTEDEAPAEEQAADAADTSQDDVADTVEDAAEDADTVEAEADTAEAEADAPVADEVADVLAPVAKPRRRIIVQKISRAEVEAAQTGAETPAEDDMSAELDAEAEAALMAELAEVEAEMGTVDTMETATDEDSAAAEMEARALAAAQAAQDQVDAETAARKQAEAEAAEAEAAIAKAQAEAQEAEDAEALAKVMAEAAEVEAEAKADEAEADVEADVEAVAEATDTDADTDAHEADEDGADENRAARLARRALMVEDEDEALNRLMDATSSRMSDDDEGAVRRASIAHLKAAVAATKADDSIAKAAADEEERELDQYRDDLARVVRPGRARPRAEGAATSRPSPLVLVSEQRIDTPAPQADAVAASDVRPRRITSGNLALAEEMEEEVEENLFDDANVESFSAYAERNDALELPDLLEAAAAHYAYVEGLEEFTRPMLMRKIASLTTGEAPSREAGLRSFGSLLREGKVVKSGNGKFVLSGKSRFAPEAREAGE